MKKIILIVGVVIVAAVVAVFALRFVLTSRPMALLPTAPGHGTSFLLESDDTNAQAAVKVVLQNRFSDLDVPIFLETVSPTQFRLVTPMVADGQNQSALEHIVGGQLEFRLIHPDSQELIREGLVEPGYEVLKLNEAAVDGHARVTSFVVKKKPEMSGKYVQRAMIAHDAVGQPEIEFTLTPEGAGIFSTVTRDNIGRQLAIVLDSKLMAAPRITGEIGANGVIAGHYTDGEAAALAGALNHPLPVPVKLIEMKKF